MKIVTSKVSNETAAVESDKIKTRITRLLKDGMTVSASPATLTVHGAIGQQRYQIVFNLDGPKVSIDLSSVVSALESAVASDKRSTNSVSPQQMEHFGESLLEAQEVISFINAVGYAWGASWPSIPRF